MIHTGEFIDKMVMVPGKTPQNFNLPIIMKAGPLLIIKERFVKGDYTMRFNKKVPFISLLLIMIIAFTGAAFAETIEFIVPWSAGGGSDTMARFMVKSIKDNNLSDANFIVNDMPGGNGQVGSAYLLSKKGKPNAWLTLSSGQISVPLAGLGKIKATQFTALAQVAGDVNLLIVSSKSPLKNIADVIKAAKSGTLNVGGSGTAAEDHLCTYLLGKATGIEDKLNYVSFSGGGEVLTNLMGGHIDIAWANPNECISQVEGGLVKMLAVTKEDRLALLPDVPSFTELGYDLVFWQVRGIHGPPDMPKDARDKAIAVIKKATETKTWAEDYVKGKVLTPRFIPGDEYTKVIKEQETMFREALGAMGILKE